ncbi:MAG: hypothetical protein RBU37_06580 [Myxococcota bacterium]|nr:hypothetical protein [Myxococcota bacterium]
MATPSPDALQLIPHCPDLAWLDLSFELHLPILRCIPVSLPNAAHVAEAWGYLCSGLSLGNAYLAHALDGDGALRVDESFRMIMYTSEGRDVFAERHFSRSRSHFNASMIWLWVHPDSRLAYSVQSDGWESREKGARLQLECRYPTSAQSLFQEMQESLELIYRNDTHSLELSHCARATYREGMQADALPPGLDR